MICSEARGHGRDLKAQKPEHVSFGSSQKLRFEHFQFSICEVSPGSRTISLWVSERRTVTAETTVADVK